MKREATTTTAASAIVDGELKLSVYDENATMRMIGNLEDSERYYPPCGLDQLRNIALAYAAHPEKDMLNALLDAYMLGRIDAETIAEAETVFNAQDLDAMAYEIYYNQELTSKKQAVSEQEEKLSQIRATLGLYTCRQK